MLEKDEAMPIIETSSLPKELDPMRETATRDVWEEDNRATAAVMAMKRMSSDAEKAGVADMTLEEINAEIAAVRSGKTEKQISRGDGKEEDSVVHLLKLLISQNTSIPNTEKHLEN